ncbi:hypothetical protein Ae406Ps2_6367 [Pseudonocardia sp. Ae406_Ps2]|nr:hypothetical protein Ae331Ps2_6290 [Pseudonocardia sp. Ae331_Ps2]OLL89927.1 hypothetical protein Ae406Ps2_6367 [Pseudonocardia sp. Ae406_Ps2]
MSLDGTLIATDWRLTLGPTAGIDLWWLGRASVIAAAPCGVCRVCGPKSPTPTTHELVNLT